MSDASPPEAAHANYGASSMERWTSCLGSPRLCAGLPSYDTEYSVDGTVAHTLAAWCLTWDERNASAFVGVVIEPMIGEKTPPITAEQARGVQVILDHVYGVLESFPSAQLRVEHRVRIPSSAVPGQMYGTCDVFIYDPVSRRIWIIDYKHGAGIHVDIKDSKQLKFYALGSLWECIANGQAVEGITIAIVQPRAFSEVGGGVREQDITVAELFEFHVYAEDRAFATLAPDAPLVPDPKYCRWCSAGAAGVCPAVIGAATALVGVNTLQELSTTPLPNPKGLSFEKMNAILDAWPLVSAWYRSVLDCAMGYAREKGGFPGRKLVYSLPRREWDLTTHTADDIATALMIYTGRSLDEVYGRSLIGITEAENAVVDARRAALVRASKESKRAFTARLNAASEKAREDLAMYMIKKPKGSLQLVPLSDDRPAVDGAQLFKGVNMEGLT